MSHGLSRISLPILEQLLVAIERRRLEPPFVETDLAEAGVRGFIGDVVAALHGIDGHAAIAVLRVAIAERVHRPPPRLDLVWTGPETRSSVSRSTSLTIHTLFEHAQRHVVVGGYGFDDPEIFRPLHAAMRDRSVQVTMFVDIDAEPKATSQADGAALATRHIDAFFRDVWTFGAPTPEVFYDPRTTMRGPPWASLHAKCVVIDDERALVTSANFTARGQTRNIEAGVLIEDRGFAEELAGQWRQLVSEGKVTRYRG